jgi:hypothetical protein
VVASLQLARATEVASKGQDNLVPRRDREEHNGTDQDTECQKKEKAVYDIDEKWE